MENQNLAAFVQHFTERGYSDEQILQISKMKIVSQPRSSQCQRESFEASQFPEGKILGKVRFLWVPVLQQEGSLTVEKKAEASARPRRPRARRSLPQRIGRHGSSGVHTDKMAAEMEALKQQVAALASSSAPSESPSESQSNAVRARGNPQPNSENKKQISLPSSAKRDGGIRVQLHRAHLCRR